MAGFTRRYSSMPDNDEILQANGVVIVDEVGVNSLTPIGSGIVGLVGEFEDGPFAADTSVPSTHPQGKVVVADDSWTGLGAFGFTINGERYMYPCASLSDGEYWNGNSYIQALGLKFRRLIAVRVDTSVGQISMTPLAFAENDNIGPWNVGTGVLFPVAVNGGTMTSIQLNGTTASITGTDTPLAGNINAGDSVDITIDSQTVTVVFASTPADLTAIRNVINTAFNAIVAYDSGGALQLKSQIGGTSSYVEINDNIGTVCAELKMTTGDSDTGTGTVPNTSLVTAADFAAAAAISHPNLIVKIFANKIRLCATQSVEIQVQSMSFGFVDGLYTINPSKDGIIPAGTIVGNNASTNMSTRVLTMQTIKVPKTHTSAINIRVRPVLDNGTFAGSSINTMDKIFTDIGMTDREWNVTNSVAISPALTSVQKDDRYQQALDATITTNGDAQTIGFIVSARQSNNIRSALVANAITASAEGCYGRKARISPPNSATLTDMRGTAEPGVSNYRSERACYCTGFKKKIPAIELRGTAGGTGFTADGIVEVHGDIVLASIDSRLPPEENSGQATDFVNIQYYKGVLDTVSGFSLSTFKLAADSGICASRWHETEFGQFEYVITTVDRFANPGRVDASRIKMSDWVSDSIALFQAPFVKKNSTDDRRGAIVTGIHNFLLSLLTGKRIKDYVVEESNTPGLLNSFTVSWVVLMIESMDNIINRVVVSKDAIITER